ncbi:hypothetical protein [Rickettsia endosymbiont of Polydrusus tereticollis]|uniref:hypothetical protein n=1 Tax=Rickettsia endosymbiont of Polydrusus tereticollis TaxID=3066251 RepID=UPI003132BD61
MPLPKKQVVVIEKPALQNKPANAQYTGNVIKPNASNTKVQDGKAAKEQIKAEKARVLAEQQKEALKAKLTRWKTEYKQILKLLQSKYPLCFSFAKKPLAIGISKGSYSARER